VSDRGVAVACQPSGEGWECQVTVGDDPSATKHQVTVTRAELADLAPGQDVPTDLVLRSFAFLLQREPRESILRRFELSVIGRYFPEYREAILRS
jgi:hypothetical protein